LGQWWRYDDETRRCRVLFEDANDFTNPAQIALAHGAAIEGYYTRQNPSGAQSVTPSFVWGNGKVGLGAYGTRSGTNLGSASQSMDSIGGELGVALAQDHLTMGVG